MFKDDILTSLAMLHSQFRDELPGYFVPLEEECASFRYAKLIDPLIEDLVDEIDEFETDEEIKSFLNMDKAKETLASILYASQFNYFCFSVNSSVNVFSIEQPCRVLGACIGVDFYRQQMSYEDVSILSYVKDLVTHQELLEVVNIFADFTHKKDASKLKKNIKVSVFSDRDMGGDLAPLDVYPDHFLSDPRLVQRAATKVRKELFSKRFYKNYESLEDYFEKSECAKPLINTILNDSNGLNFDEKTVLQSIAEAFDIRDQDSNLEGYVTQIENDVEDLFDRRDDELNDAYKNIFKIDSLAERLYEGEEPYKKEDDDEPDYKNDPNYGYAESTIDEVGDMDGDENNEGMMDEIILMYLENEFDVEQLKEKILDTKGNRPTSVLYADHKSDTELFELISDIKKKESTDVYYLVETLNEIVRHLSFFDKDKSLTKMSENFIDVIEDIFKKQNKEYDADFFKNSKNLYNDFRSFAKQVEQADQKKLKKKGLNSLDVDGNQSSSGPSTDFNLN